MPRRERASGRHEVAVERRHVGRRRGLSFGPALVRARSATSRHTYHRWFSTSKVGRPRSTIEMREIVD